MQNYKLISQKTGETLFAGFFKDYTTCLEEAVKRHIPLNNVSLKNRNLSNANLDDGIFADADFSGSNLTGANMSECYLKDARFENTSLFNTCFAHSNLTGCDFNGASFGATDISGSILQGCSFSTLSAFTLDFCKAREMGQCAFISHQGQSSKISTPPIVLSGLGKLPIIMLDDDVYEGHRRINKQYSYRLMNMILEIDQNSIRK